MNYTASISIKKGVSPAIIIIAGANALQAAAAAVGVNIEGEHAYTAITALYSFVRGFRNWRKNRWR
jgi:hypothetical protein